MASDLVEEPEVSLTQQTSVEEVGLSQVIAEGEVALVGQCKSGALNSLGVSALVDVLNKLGVESLSLSELLSLLLLVILVELQRSLVVLVHIENWLSNLLESHAASSLLCTSSHRSLLRVIIDEGVDQRA